MKILVTGSSGFIGSAVTKHLRQLRVPHLEITSSSTGSSRKIDKSHLTLAEFFGQNDATALIGGDANQLCLIHCAWRGLPDYSTEICQWNFDFTQRLFRHALNLGVSKIVGLGSCLEYGALKGEVSEERLSLSPSTFGQTKLALSKELQKLCADNSVDYRWARVFYAYGPGQRSTSLIPSVINNLSAGSPVEVRNPKDVVDLIHVTDVARALVAMALKPGENGVFNLGSGLPYAVADVTAAIEDLWSGAKGRKVALTTSNQHGFWANMQKTQQYVSTKDFMPLEQGLQELIKIRRETV